MKKALLILILSIALVLCGCSAEQGLDASRSDQIISDAGKYVISTEGKVIINTDTGEETAILHNIFNTDRISKVCANGSKIYCLTEGSKTTIIEIDTTDFSENVIYERSNETYNFFGVQPVSYSVETFINEHIDYFAVGENSIYFYNDINKTVKWYDRFTKTESILLSDISEPVFAGDAIYFISSGRMLSCYSFSTDTTTVIAPDIAVSQIIFDGEQIWFRQVASDSNIGYINENGDPVMTDVSANSFCALKDTLYYIGDDSYVYRTSENSTDERFTDLKPIIIKALPEANCLYLYCYDRFGKIYIVSADNDDIIKEIEL